jgi:rubrerythrin
MNAQLKELLLHALETEKGGIQVYTAALRCTGNEDLSEEWEEYLDQTKNHERILLEVFAELGIDPEAKSPGRDVVHQIGESLVRAIEMARAAGDPAAAQLVAAECVIEAETKDHLNWELIGEASKKAPQPEAKILKAAHDEVEDEEDEHLYHTTAPGRRSTDRSIRSIQSAPPSLSAPQHCAGATMSSRLPFPSSSRLPLPSIDPPKPKPLTSARNARPLLYELQDALLHRLEHCGLRSLESGFPRRVR